ncbi:PE family protein [Mycobacterium riyadhense]|uniref:PE family protein n=1 Tax=Mycobacterium riyadhense TaxID=486698 RepID=UPI0033904DEE
MLTSQAVDIRKTSSTPKPPAPSSRQTIVHRQTAEEGYVVPNGVSTESLAAAALDVERIGRAVAVANKAAAAAPTGVVAPNADEVSIDVAPLLGAPLLGAPALSHQERPAMPFRMDVLVRPTTAPPGVARRAGRPKSWDQLSGTCAPSIATARASRA